jgi:hypothetical protein
MRAWVRAHPYAVLAVLFFIVFAFPFQHRKDSEWESVYVRAAQHLRAGSDFYLAQIAYLYPPFTACLALPFTYLLQPVGRAVWYLINVASLAVLLYSAWRLAGGGQPRAGNERKEHLVCMLGLACAFRYALDCLSHQQTDLVIGALVLGSCLALARRRSVLAAVGFGLAAAMKCTALLWAPYLLWRGRWKAAGLVVLVALGANLLPNLVSAPSTGKLWLAEWYSFYLAPMRSASYAPGTWGSAIIYNQSLAGAFTRWARTDWVWNWQGCDIVDRPESISPVLLGRLTYGTELLLLLAAVLLLGRRRWSSEPIRERPGPAREVLEYSVVLILMLLLSPMSGKPHFCTLLLPAFCVARAAVYHELRWLRVLLALAILTGLATIKNLLGEDVSTVTLWYGGVTASTLLLLAGCCTLLLQRGLAVQTSGATQADAPPALAA